MPLNSRFSMLLSWYHLRPPGESTQQGKKDTPFPEHLWSAGFLVSPLGSFTFHGNSVLGVTGSERLSNLLKVRAGEWQRWDSNADLPDTYTTPSHDLQQDKLRVHLLEGTELCPSRGGHWKLPLPLSPLTSSLCFFFFFPFIGDTAFIISI